MEGNLHLGDYVIYRPAAFGMDNPILTQIDGLTVTESPREKYGSDFKEVSWDLIKENRVVFDLHNKYWAYSEQVCIEESKLANVLMKETPLKDLPMYLGRGCDMVIESRLKESIA